MRVVTVVQTSLARHPAAARGLQIALVALIGMSIWNAVSAVDAQRREWGDTATVLVAANRLGPGDAVSPSNVRIEQWPRAVVPAGALDAVGEGRLVRQVVGAGEILTTADVTARSGTAGLLPSGTRGVAIEVPADLLAALHLGDSVGVVVAGDAAADGTVVGVGTTSLTVAVPRSASAEIADATLLGTVTVTVSGEP